MTVPPQNLDAEESVLGAMLLSAKAIEAVEDEVTWEDFYKPSHGLIFRVVLAINRRGLPVDAITVAAKLEEMQKLQECGGKIRINELAALVPSPSSARHYAILVREAAVRRRVGAAGLTIQDAATAYAGTPDELVAYAEQALAAATTTTQTGDFGLLTTDMSDLMSRIGTAVETGVPIFGAKTGFGDLDVSLSGLHPGQLIVLAARPGVGKSLLAQNIAENMAKANTPVALFSLEMTKEELQLRTLARASKIDLTKLRTGTITPEEYATLVTISSGLASRPFYVEDNPTLRPPELRARARRLKNKHGLGLLIVDYIQLMVPEVAKNTANAEIAAITRSLKLLAKELQVPVLAISQLNRNAEGRQDKRPTLADLRDSGAIEQDADVVLFIYRDSLYNDVPLANACDAEVIVAKSRMGQQETIKLVFNGSKQTFTSLQKDINGSS